MRKKNWIWLPYIAAFAALAAGTCYDYELTDFFYQRLPWLGMLFERVMLFPLILLLSFSMCIFASFYHKRWWLLGSYAAALYAVADIKGYWIAADHLIIWIGSAVVSLLLVLLLQQLCKLLGEEWIRRHVHWFRFYACVFLSAVLLTTVLKLFWGRIRYRQMESALQFVPWYRPQLFSGYHSFPSGHTTVFTTILCFLEWKKNPYQRLTVWKCVLLWVVLLLMPLTRMMMGAHYLSDTAAGFLITYTMYLLFRAYFKRRGYL